MRLLQSATLSLLGTAALLAGCETPPPPSTSVAEILQRPAERALVEGMRSYDGGNFESAERNFHEALTSGLRDKHDTAVAYKHLAFIACAFNRVQECEANFRAAFEADARFRLGSAEIGHPVWGPVYRRVAKERGVDVN